MSKTMSELLAARKMPQDSVPICMRPDVMAEISSLERRIERLMNDADDDPRLAGAGAETAAELADRIRELEAVAADFTLELRLQAVPSLVWHKVKDAHTSEVEGKNPETGLLETQEKLDLAGLMDELFPQSIVSPEMTDGERVDFRNGLTEGQWEQVIRTMWDLNRGGANVPKSLRASMALQRRNGKPGPGEQ